MNAYEQLLVIRDKLEHNGASEDSIDLVDKFLERSSAERQSDTNVPMVMMVRHLLRQREANDNYAIYNDLQELLEAAQPGSGTASISRRNEEEDDAPYAYEEERKPRPHSFYKQQKKERETKKP